jgi:hypothetical protein
MLGDGVVITCIHNSKEMPPLDVLNDFCQLHLLMRKSTLSAQYVILHNKIKCLVQPCKNLLIDTQ